MTIQQIFFASFINLLGSMAPPLCAPILADYFVIGNKKYDQAFLHRQPPVRLAGVLTFVIGATLGYLFSQNPLPFHLPAGLVALVISFFVYIALYHFLPDKTVDQKLLKAMEA